MTTPIAVRAAVEGDAPELARLLTALGFPTEPQDVRGRWALWVGAGNSAVVADCDDRRLAGVATLHRMSVLHRPAPVGRITALVVDDAWRGRGVGRALVEAAEAQLARAGCGLLEVTSNQRLAGAHAFYARLGYERTSVRFAKSLVPAG
jgi:GNAT superfamily N-acetyltransferase